MFLSRARFVFFLSHVVVLLLVPDPVPVPSYRSGVHLIQVQCRCEMTAESGVGCLFGGDSADPQCKMGQLPRSLGTDHREFQPLSSHTLANLSPLSSANLELHELSRAFAVHSTSEREAPQIGVRARVASPKRPWHPVPSRIMHYPSLSSRVVQTPPQNINLLVTLFVFVCSPQVCFLSVRTSINLPTIVLRAARFHDPSWWSTQSRSYSVVAHPVNYYAARGNPALAHKLESRATKLMKRDLGVAKT
ncbi:hypothetical protein EDC01DRAFT_762429 [Geopyxis carbonaria]|nr:hypothetical protein EDC01DRAFT_762429 [Geopyxis carbonaria]